MFVLVVFVVVFFGSILKPLLDSVLCFGIDGTLICVLLMLVVAMIIVGLLLIVVMVILGPFLIVVMILVGFPLIMVMIIVGFLLIVVMIIVGLPQTELLWASYCILVGVVFVAMVLSLLVVFFHTIVLFVLPSTSPPHMSMTNMATKTVSG